MKVFHLFPLLIPCSLAPYSCVAPPRGAHAASVFALNAGAVSFGQIVKVGKFPPTKSERERNGEGTCCNLSFIEMTNGCLFP